LERTARLGIGEIDYPDIPGVCYGYNSRVARHADVKVGDLAVIRDTGVVLGAGWIDEILVTPGIKILRRCPTCRSTDYKLRVKPSRATAVLIALPNLTRLTTMR